MKNVQMGFEGIQRRCLETVPTDRRHGLAWYSLVFYLVSLPIAKRIGDTAVRTEARDVREMPTSIGLDEGDLAGLLNDGTAEANFADKVVGDEAVRQISDALASNCSKTRVFLDRNCVGADGAAALGDMLKVRNRNP